MQSSSSITLTVLGGGGEIGASCFLLGFDGHQVLLDSGTHPKKDGIDALPEYSLLHRAPEALLISHAHVDHCGSMPYVMKQFPTVRTHATLPTTRIMDRMLHNSVSVMELVAKERGVQGYPLYTHDDVNYAMRSVTAHEFQKPFRLAMDPPVEAMFQPAGHVLGAASVLLRLPGHTVYYTADISEGPQELLAGFKPLPANEKIDTLIIESTHGATEEDKVHDYAAEAQRFGVELTKVLERGGTVLVPSFALGRTQEILTMIARMQEDGVIPQVPVYASGLGRAIYEIYARFEDHLMPESYLYPLDQFGRIGNVWERSVTEKLIEKPCIIVATSGMMLENTPSAMIAQEMVKYTHHGIFFVGYVDPETPGYKLLHAEAGDRLQFSLRAPKVPVMLRDIQRFHFSAHAPRSTLKSVIDRIRPKNIVYVHGDAPALAWMQEHTGGGYNSFTPQVGQTLTLGV